MGVIKEKAPNWARTGIIRAQSLMTSLKSSSRKRKRSAIAKTI
jgi:hypothetical protein